MILVLPFGAFLVVMLIQAWKVAMWHHRNRECLREATPRLTNGEIWRTTYRLLFSLDRCILNELPLSLALIVRERIKAWPHRLAPGPYLMIQFLAGLLLCLFADILASALGLLG
jgi:hypothetical protein